MILYYIRPIFVKNSKRDFNRNPIPKKEHPHCIVPTPCFVDEFHPLTDLTRSWDETTSVRCDQVAASKQPLRIQREDVGRIVVTVGRFVIYLEKHAIKPLFFQ